MTINILKSCKSVFAYVKNRSSPSHIKSSIPWRPPLAEILDPRLTLASLVRYVQKSPRSQLFTYQYLSVGEVGATPKLLNLDIEKMGKKNPGIISDGVCWKPGHLSFKHTKQFPESFFRLGAKKGTKNSKNGDFSALPRNSGRLAQLVERSSGDREVPGSIPSVSRSSEWALQLW